MIDMEQIIFNCGIGVLKQNRKDVVKIDETEFIACTLSQNCNLPIIIIIMKELEHTHSCDCT